MKVAPLKVKTESAIKKDEDLSSDEDMFENTKKIFIPESQ